MRLNQTKAFDQGLLDRATAHRLLSRVAPHPSTVAELPRNPQVSRARHGHFRGVNRTPVCVVALHRAHRHTRIKQYELWYGVFAGAGRRYVPSTRHERTAGLTPELPGRSPYQSTAGAVLQVLC